ncbi:PGF-pre-PGF domain-containing protein (plasmid) [Halosegnis rubeus]|uniref:PGF-pre-PGF domain-containing protein n=1 Tax=Halosegnis rubeus TaxID=2212850 RepID=A0A5N5U714_9EURY|nr:PGF-pre-PGF domain-containing protein [Halosegnis rubeus]
MLATSGGFVGTATAAAGNTAPDCGTISYTTNSSGWHEVTNVSQLQCINQNHSDATSRSDALSKRYVQTRDIDATGTNNWNTRSSFTDTFSVFSAPKPVELSYAPIDSSSVTVTDTADGTSLSFNVVDADSGAIDLTEKPDGDVTVSYDTQSPRTLGFEPIGNRTDDFTGAFDGSSHTISNLFINRPGHDQIGLFGNVYGVTITNVGLTSVDITGNEDTGGVAGEVGESSSQVSHSFVTGDISADGSAGGVVGTVTRGTLEDSYANVTVTSPGNYVGGVVGFVNVGTVQRTYATGAVSGLNSGGVSGYISGSGTVQNSYWDKGTTDQGSVIGKDNGGTTSGLTGYGSTSDTTPAPEMQGSSASSNMGNLDFTSTWETVENGDADATGDGYPILQSANGQAQLEAQDAYAYAGGDGSTDNPYEIANWYHLNNTRENLDAEFILTAGLDSNTAGYDDVASSSANGGNGFDPIGDDSSRFTGTFNGTGHTISNLSIDRGWAFDVGLFGYVNGGTIENVGVENADITGKERVGGLVGKNFGTVSNSYATGTVYGDKEVGGLVGFNFGNTTASYATSDVSGTGNDVGGLVGSNVGNTSGSYATGNVSGTGIKNVGGLAGVSEGEITESNATGTISGNNLVGGLVGVNTGTVTESYATGNVSGTGDVVGGLVARNFGATVTKSYATGSVTGTKGVGGLVGINSGISSAKVSESYAAGSVTGTDDVGGLVGVNNRTVSDSYWDTARTNQSDGVGRDDGGTATNMVGLTTAEMTGDRAAGNMGPFDFSSTWQTTGDDGSVEGYGVFYPTLQNNTQQPAPSATLYAGGDGSASTPYEIANWYHLDNVRQNLGSEFVLTADLDSNTAGYDDVASSSANGGNGFDPIGDDSSRFTGTFNGTGRTISNLFIDRSVYVGLFGYVDGGRVENVGVVDADISVTIRWMGGLVGYNDQGTVSGSYATGHVSGGTNDGNHVGGLVGENNGGTVTESHAASSVGGLVWIGGLVGTNDGGLITESYATGDVSSGSGAGGLVGKNSGTVTESYATGDASGVITVVGGLAGQNSGTVNESYATGDVEAAAIVGGLVGRIKSGTVSGSYATGDVTGDNDRAGGFAGEKNGGTITDGYWDDEAATVTEGGSTVDNQGVSDGGGDVIALTTTEMQRFAPLANMDGFSFESPETWLVTSGYPALAWESVTELTVDTVEASDQTVAENKSGTINVTAKEGGVNAGEGVTIEVLDNDSLDGFATGDTTVTDANGKATFSFDEPDDGSYEPEFAWADDTTVSATPTVTIDTTAPTIDSARRVDDTTIDVDFSDGGAGIEKNSISSGDFSLDSGSISTIDTSGVTDGGTGTQTVTINLNSAVDSDTVTVSLQSDGIDDIARNTQTSGSADASNMDGVAPTFDSVSKTDDTTITATIADGANVDESSIARSDFSLSTGSISSISTTENGANTDVTLNLDSAVGVNTVDVSIAGSIADTSGNVLSSATKTVLSMDGVVPSISGSSLASDNGHVDVTFSEGVFQSDSSSALTAGDLTATVTQNGGTVSSASVSSLTKTDGSALAGGETTIRAQLSLTGTPADGVESVAIQPIDGSSVGDDDTNLMAGSDTTGSITLNDRTPPSLSDDSGGTDEETSGEIVADLTSNDNDQGALSVTKVKGNAANVGSPTAGDSGGLFTIASDGTVSFDPNGEFESESDADSSTTQITVIISDAAGNTNTQTVTARINGVNDPPAFDMASPSLSVSQDASATSIDEKLSVTDPDDEETVTWTVLSKPSHGSLSGLPASEPTGTDSVTPSGLTYEPDRDYAGSDSFDIQVSDPNGGTDTVTVSVITSQVNDAPTAISLTSTNVTQSSGTNAVVGRLSAADVDDSSHTFSLVSGGGDGDNAEFNVDSGDLRADDAGSLAEGDYDVRLEADDGSGGTYEKAVTISVTDDIAPTITSSTPADDATGVSETTDITITFSEDVVFGSGSVILREDDGGFSNSETFDVSTDTGGGDGTVSISGRNLTITPTSEFTSSTEYAVQIDAGTLTDTAASPNDFGGIGDNATVNFTTTDSMPPTASVGPDATVGEGESVSFDGTGSTDNVGIVSHDWDFDDGDTAIGATTTHTFDNAGTYEVELTVADALNNEATAIRTITVESTGGGGDDSSGGSSAPADTDDGQPSADEDTTHVVTGTRSDDGTASFNVADSGGYGSITLDLRGTATDDSQSAAGSDGNDADDGVDTDTVVVDRLSITPTESATREFELSVRTWSADSIEPGNETDDAGTVVTAPANQGRANYSSRTDTRAFLNITGSVPVGYVEVTHTNPDTDIENVTFRFRIQKAYLDERDVAPSAVALYRNETDGIVRLPTENVGSNGSYYVFESVSPGLSLFAIGSSGPTFVIERASGPADTITVPEPVTVDATVRNLGRAAGAYTAELQSNGTVVAAREVELAPNSTRTVSLSFTPADPGEYTLTVGTVVAGTVLVQSDEALNASTPAPTEQANPQQTPGTTRESTQPAGDNEDTESATDASGPGFGVAVAFGVLLMVVIVLARRQS